MLVRDFSKQLPREDGQLSLLEMEAMLSVSGNPLEMEFPTYPLGESTDVSLLASHCS
jgi:hypothetical protein